MPTWTKEQKMAIELDGFNIIVSAGAGSGKTAVLSERVIYKLKNGVHVDELLILTFTRAAAEEMKDRIRKKIMKDSLLTGELERLDSAYITTFDSFALSVLKKYHYLLNISSSIEITDETIVKLEKKRIMERVFKDFYEQEDENFLKLVADFSLKNDKVLMGSILDLAEKIENFSDRDDFIANIKNDFFENDNIIKILNNYLNLLEEIKQEVKLELDNLRYYFDGDYIKKVEDVVLPIVNSCSLDDLISLKNSKLPSVPRGSDESAKRVKDNLKNALNNLFSFTELGNEEKIKDNILKSQETVNTIITIINKYFEKLTKYKKENNIYTFTDVSNLSMKILKENEWARVELANRFKEIMIDEYQDTNDVQENFMRLIARNNIYMVGDIKQSIYKFRGSNPSIFKDKYDSYSKNIDGKKIDLIKNFRSRSEVLDDINRIFALLMDGDLGGAEYTVSHEMVFGNMDYTDEKMSDYNYSTQILEYDNPKPKDFEDYEVEIFAIGRDIQNKMEQKLEVFDKDSSKLRPINYNDFVIILDRSKYFFEFKRVFEYLGIPLTILKDDKMNASMEIYLFKNIIDMIIRIKNHDFGTQFKYDFMSIGRSFLYEMSDDELFTMITKETFKDSKLFKDFSEIDDYNSKSLEEFIYYILDISKFYQKIYKIGDYENINVRISKLIMMANNLGSMGYTIEDYRDYLFDIIEDGLEINYTDVTNEDNSVKILTIHKSKGLEYPICYFADLNHKYNTSELKDKFIASKKYGLIIPVFDDDKDENADTVLKVLYKNEFMKEEIGEKIRLFYVALTRAREKMIIVIPKKETEKLEKNVMGTIELARRLKFSSLGDFIYGVKDYMKEFIEEINLDDIGLTKNYLYKKESNVLKENMILEDYTVEEIDIVNELIEEKQFAKSNINILSNESVQNMRLGTKIHEILEYVDLKKKNVDFVKDDFIKQKVCKFLDSDLLKNVQNGEIYKEYEFIYNRDEKEYHGSIDLMIEYDKYIDIIDYKLKDTTDEHYLDQLFGYKDYVESISNKNVNIYLYSIIDESYTKLN